MPKAIALGIVLFNNSTREVCRLLRSLQANHLPADFRQEWFWWDNSPTDRLRRELEAAGQGLGYRWTGENVGFAVAHNRLMREAFSTDDSRWYVCVNPDAMLHARCIFELIQVAERNPTAGLVEGRLFPDEHPKPYDPITLRTPWCSGCVLLITRALFETVGGFDENFFMYCEDVDLSWRARAAGFQTMIAPAALAYHYAQGRPKLRARELAVRRSAAYLATKYGATEFAGRMLSKYESLGGPRFELPKTRPRPPPHGSFDQLLRFSESRW